jgi:hypothetical protein
MTKDQLRRLTDFYFDEIERNKTLMFKTPKINELKKIESRIIFYKEKLRDLGINLK